MRADPRRAVERLASVDRGRRGRTGRRRGTWTVRRRRRRGRPRSRGPRAPRVRARPRSTRRRTRRGRSSPALPAARSTAPRTPSAARLDAHHAGGARRGEHAQRVDGDARTRRGRCGPRSSGRAARSAGASRARTAARSQASGSSVRAVEPRLGRADRASRWRRRRRGPPRRRARPRRRRCPTRGETFTRSRVAPRATSARARDRAPQPASSMPTTPAKPTSVAPPPGARRAIARCAAAGGRGRRRRRARAPRGARGPRRPPRAALRVALGTGVGVAAQRAQHAVVDRGDAGEHVVGGGVDARGRGDRALTPPVVVAVTHAEEERRAPVVRAVGRDDGVAQLEGGGEGRERRSHRVVRPAACTMRRRARMAEQADAGASKAPALRGVRVRVPLRARRGVHHATDTRPRRPQRPGDAGPPRRRLPRARKLPQVGSIRRVAAALDRGPEGRLQGPRRLGHRRRRRLAPRSSRASAWASSASRAAARRTTGMAVMRLLAGQRRGSRRAGSSSTGVDLATLSRERDAATSGATGSP